METDYLYGFGMLYVKCMLSRYLWPAVDLVIILS